MQLTHSEVDCTDEIDLTASEDVIDKCVYGGNPAGDGALC